MEMQLFLSPYQTHLPAEFSAGKYVFVVNILKKFPNQLNHGNVLIRHIHYMFKMVVPIEICQAFFVMTFDQNPSSTKGITCWFDYGQRQIY